MSEEVRRFLFRLLEVVEERAARRRVRADSTELIREDRCRR